ncbi:hypothetical protein [Streptomyces bangladeshensis]|uniref:Uncharacterized protein n=1 Tax=Streptomyces bangladeshensis TaxID=295352 RepID=A0ABP5N3Y9_9ACTN
MTDEQPRRFHLQRTTDITGVSGTGRVADGVLWPDGTVSIRWRGERPSTVHWGSLADAEAVHGHGGHTRIVWDDEPADDPMAVLRAIEDAPRYELVPGCPHCPDGHTPPDHGQPWGAFIGPERDGDGQPTQIIVARVAGAHVAESDAAWIQARLNSQP